MNPELHDKSAVNTHGLLTEQGRVVAVADDHVWVETFSASTCGSCSAQKGCGQGLLNSVGRGRQNLLKVLLPKGYPRVLGLGDTVDIAVPEKVLIGGAFWVYLLPLLSLLVGMGAVDQFAPAAGDTGAALGALGGFIAGLGLVRLHALLTAKRADYQPRLLDPAA